MEFAGTPERPGGDAEVGLVVMGRKESRWDHAPYGGASCGRRPLAQAAGSSISGRGRCPCGPIFQSPAGTCHWSHGPGNRPRGAWPVRADLRRRGSGHRKMSWP